MSDRAEQPKALIERLRNEQAPLDVASTKWQVMEDAAAALTASEAEVTRLETGIAEAYTALYMESRQAAEMILHGLSRPTTEKRVLLTHPHDGHGTNETCLLCEQPTTDTNGAHA